MADVKQTMWMTSCYNLKAVQQFKTRSSKKKYMMKVICINPQYLWYIAPISSSEPEFS